MKLKRNYNLMISICFLIIAFDVSYAFSTRMFSHKNNVNISKVNKVPKIMEIDTNEDNSKYTLNSNDNDDEVISKEAKLIYKVKYINTNDSIVEKVQDAKELVGLKKKDLKNSFIGKDYYLESLHKDEIICAKDVERYVYEKGKYVIGMNNEFLAIYKINEEGKMIFVENSQNLFGEKAKKISDFSKEFYDELLFGSKEMQFDTLDEAENILSDDNS